MLLKKFGMNTIEASVKRRTYSLLTNEEVDVTPIHKF